MRATSPSGSADFVGLVQWAGELGYGIREPESSQEHKDSSNGEILSAEEEGN